MSAGICEQCYAAQRTFHELIVSEGTSDGATQVAPAYPNAASSAAIARAQLGTQATYLAVSSGSDRPPLGSAGNSAPASLTITSGTIGAGTSGILAPSYSLSRDGLFTDLSSAGNNAPSSAGLANTARSTSHGLEFRTNRCRAAGRRTVVPSVDDAQQFLQAGRLCRGFVGSGEHGFESLALLRSDDRATIRAADVAASLPRRASIPAAPPESIAPATSG